MSTMGCGKVDGVDGGVTPLDPEAVEAAITCDVPPVPHFGPLFSISQAELLVWAAVYDCFARPESTSFTAFAADPAHWIVEGRKDEEEGQAGAGQPVFYGLWIVDATTSGITPSDELAAQTVGRSCYQAP